MKNEYTVHIVIKKYLFVYLIKAWTIDKNNTLELHFKKYCMKHQIDKVEKNMCKPNFNRNKQVSGYCYGNYVIGNGHVFLEIGGIIFKKIKLSANYCVGKSGSGKGRKFIKPVTNEIYKSG